MNSQTNKQKLKLNCNLNFDIQDWVVIGPFWNIFICVLKLTRPVSDIILIWLCRFTFTYFARYEQFIQRSKGLLLQCSSATHVYNLPGVQLQHIELMIRHRDLLTPHGCTKISRMKKKMRINFLFFTHTLMGDAYFQNCSSVFRMRHWPWCLFLVDKFCSFIFNHNFTE